MSDPNSLPSEEPSRGTGDLQATVSSAELSTLALFADFTEAERDHWASRCVSRRLEVGEYVYREGEAAEEVYGLLDGTAAIFREAVGVPVQLLGRIEAGELLGHVCVFADAAHLASARATSPSRVVGLSKADFEGLLESKPDLYTELEDQVTAIYSSHLSAILALEASKEVRMRVSYDVELELEDGQRSKVLLDNLSVGGFCLRGAPETWEEGAEESFRLILPAGSLDLAGRVAWRRDGACGVAFHQMSENHDTLVQMAVRLLLES